MTSHKIIVTPLMNIKVVGGNVLRVIKNNDSGFEGFGEAYFSWIDPGSIKGWKCHNKMYMNIVVPVGRVKFVFRITNQDGSEDFQVEEVGVDSYVRLSVPPGVWFAFQGISASSSLILNIASIVHDSDEVMRAPISEINYDWR